MNILPLVFGFLTLLSIMTYASLDSYLRLSQVRSEYLCYVQNSSREMINQAQIELYQSRHAEGKKRGRQDRVNATRNLNLALWASKDLQSRENKFLEPTERLLTNLIDILYKNELFYQKSLAEKPDFIADLFSRWKEALQKNEYEGKRITKKEQMANLDLDDEELQEFLNKVFRPQSESETKCLGGKPQIPLYDFIEVNSQNVRPLRIYLLRRPLLLAIFQDENLVDDILETRMELYRQVKNKSITKEVASSQFESQYQSQLPPDFPIDFFNFSVSTTRPPR